MHPDPNDNIIQLSDRVKELSYTTGTSNMVLEGAAPGFSRFQDFYPQSGLVFYAITDGSRYEVGSGHYLATGTTPFYSSEQIRRYPFRSSSSNTKVDWPAGTKEVYVTYPAPFSVFTAFGVDERFSQPQRSGIAFWDNDGVASGTNILNYDSSGNWDKDNHFLGLHTHTPGYAIDIGGPAHYSILKASGLFLNTSGIIFSGGYDGGGQHSTRQVDPFLKNQVDATTGMSAVVDVSGWVNESLVLKTQAAAQVFAGPLNDCGGGCPDGYPAFRVLHHTDIPDLSDFYLTGYNIAPDAMSGIPFFHKSGVLTYDKGFVWNDDTNKLGINHSNPGVELDLVGRARISSNLVVGGNLEVSGNLDVAGTTTYIDSTNVTIWDKQLELASMSGNATHDQMDSYINDGGLLVRSSGDGNTDTGDKKWTWENTSNTWKSHTSNGILIGVKASGMIFANGTAISGAYQGGSGIDINGFNIDIGNVFSMSGNDNAAYGVSNQQVHQADNIVVSGVSGVSTWITKTGSKTTLHIDPSALSGVLQGNIDTANANRWPYASGVGNSGLLKSELFKVSGVAGGWDSVTGKGLIHAVSGYVLDSGYAMSGSLQYQIDNLGSAGEVNQNAFSVMAVSGAFHSNGTSYFNVSANAKTDTITFVSGDNNAILVSGNGVDTITISGDPQFRLGADNTVNSVASGYIGQNDGITISGGYGLTTTHNAGTVTVAWSGGDNLFSLRGDSDAGTGGSTISSETAVNISGDAYITTTRDGDTIKISWSGVDDSYDWLNNPGSLAAMTSGGADNADEMLIWDDDAGAWKKFTVAEMSAKFSSGSGGSQNLYHTITVDNTDTEYTWDDTSFTPGSTTESLEFVSRHPDLTIHADATTKSVGFMMTNLTEIANSGFFSSELFAVSGNSPDGNPIHSGLIPTHSGFFSEELHEVSGVGGLLDSKANIASPTFTGTPAGPTPAATTDTTQLATTAFVHDVVAASGEDHYEDVRASGQILKDLIDTNVTNIALKANIASPTFTGTVSAPTVTPATTDDTQVATTAFVHDVAQASGQLLKVNSGSGIDIYDAVTITANLNKDYYQKIPSDYSTGFSNINIGKDAQAWTSTDWVTNSAHVLTGNQVWGSDAASYGNDDYTTIYGYGSISIGHEAGYQQNVSTDATRRSTHKRNVMIGYQAGRNMPHQLSDSNVLIGSAAGGHKALTYDSSSFTDKRMLGNTCIGRRAGYYRDTSSTSRQPQRYNVFIGHLAGSDIDTDYSYHGSYNITIGGFPDPRAVSSHGHSVSESHKDLVNGSPVSDGAGGYLSTSHSYNLNIANLITGDWNTTGSYKKRVKIGDITAGTVQPQGTLELLAADTATTTFFIARAASQGQPLMSVESVSANYNDNPTQTSNQVINKNGFLRIPIFDSPANLLAVSASDNPGMVAIYNIYSNPSVTPWYREAFSDGTNWRMGGTANNVIT